MQLYSPIRRGLDLRASTMALAGNQVELEKGGGGGGKPKINYKLIITTRNTE